jgi:hypothetical protein
MKDGKMGLMTILALKESFSSLVTRLPMRKTEASSPPLSNIYKLKTTKDPRACFICGKASTSVFDAHDDFFFVCPSHVKDAGFCTIINQPTPPSKEESESDKEKEDDKEGDEFSKVEILMYRLHRSILFLREREREKKDKVKLLKSLK